MDSPVRAEPHMDQSKRRRAADAAGVSASNAAGRFSDSDASFAPRARRIGLAQRKILWRSPTAIRLTHGRPADRLTRVQGERQRSLPTPRQWPWPCDPGAMNRSLLCPCTPISPHRAYQRLAGVGRCLMAITIRSLYWRLRPDAENRTNKPEIIAILRTDTRPAPCSDDEWRAPANTST